MILILTSIILLIVVLVTIYYLITNGQTWYFIIIGGLGSFFIAFLFICIILLLSVILIGKHMAKTYHPKAKHRHWFIREIARFCNFWLGVRFKLEGFEKIPKDTPIVIYTNHQGFLDMFLFFQVFKDFPHASLYKEEHDKNIVIGGIAKALGGMGLSRENDRSSAETIIKVINEVKAGVNFMIYPEGTRSKGPNLLPFRAGAFKVVQKADAHLVILVNDNSYKIARRMPFRTKVLIKIVDVLAPSDIKTMKTHELSDLVKAKMQNALDEAREKYRFLKIPKRYLKPKDTI